MACSDTCLERNPSKQVYHNRRNVLQVQRTTDQDNQLSPTNKLSEKYCFLAKIGYGTDGEVGKYQCLRTRQLVAIKSTRCSDQSGRKMPLSVRREVDVLSKIKHENIVVMRDMVLTKGHGGTFVHLVYEFCEHDLAGLLKCKELTLFPGEVKWVMKHLLEGVAFMHECNIMHRDLKTANILITNQGVVKVADFGLARRTLLKGQEKYTSQVVTLWYRSPELLLGDNKYSKAVDMWSVGCIMAELLLSQAIFRGRTEQDQLKQIVSWCGSITPTTVPGVERLPLYQAMGGGLPQSIRNNLELRLIECRIMDRPTLDLLAEHLLVLDPAKRDSAVESFGHCYFFKAPYPTNFSAKLSELKKCQYEYRHLYKLPQHARQLGFVDVAGGPAGVAEPSSYAPSGSSGAGPSGLAGPSQVTVSLADM